MLQSLMNSKQLCYDFAVKDKTFYLSFGDWKHIAECLSALEPIKIATTVLQTEVLLPGDFYATWLKCRLSLQKLKHFRPRSFRCDEK